MRLFVVTACVTALMTAPALACPRRMLCIVQPDGAPTAEVARTESPIRLPDVRAVQLQAATRIDFGDAPERGVDRGARTNADALRSSIADEIELPWIWQVLREQYNANVPKYEQPNRFKLALSPVVVASPSWDAIPGVGVAGDF